MIRYTQGRNITAKYGGGYTLIEYETGTYMYGHKTTNKHALEIQDKFKQCTKIEGTTLSVYTGDNIKELNITKKDNETVTYSNIIDMDLCNCDHFFIFDRDTEEIDCYDYKDVKDIQIKFKD